MGLEHVVGGDDDRLDAVDFAVVLHEPVEVPDEVRVSWQPKFNRLLLLSEAEKAKRAEHGQQQANGHIPHWPRRDVIAASAKEHKQRILNSNQTENLENYMAVT